MQNKPNVTLSTGRVIGHRPYLSAGVPNGATEAYVVGDDNANMTNEEWTEYCAILRSENNTQPANV